jgi:serine/threonine protein kinase
MFTGDPPFFDDTQEKIFENIKRGKLNMPDTMSKEAKDFVKKLMIRDPLERQKFIDNGGLKTHPWVEGVGRKVTGRLGPDQEQGD